MRLASRMKAPAAFRFVAIQVESALWRPAYADVKCMDSKALT